LIFHDIRTRPLTAPWPQSASMHSALFRPPTAAAVRVATVAGLAVIALAAGATAEAPAGGCPPHGSAEGLAAANVWRASGADCGTRGPHGPALPLRWDDALQAMAQAQATRLAADDPDQTLHHRDVRGRALLARADAAGLPWWLLAENLARGQGSLAELMQAWAASEGHCANLLDPRLSAAGLACVPAVDGRPVWVLVLAQLRS